MKDLFIDIIILMLITLFWFTVPKMAVNAFQIAIYHADTAYISE